jgi:hypothetical protein
MVLWNVELFVRLKFHRILKLFRGLIDVSFQVKFFLYQIVDFKIFKDFVNIKDYNLFRSQILLK